MTRTSSRKALAFVAHRTKVKPAFSIQDFVFALWVIPQFSRWVALEERRSISLERAGRGEDGLLACGLRAIAAELLSEGPTPGFSSCSHRSRPQVSPDDLALCPEFVHSKPSGARTNSFTSHRTGFPRCSIGCHIQIRRVDSEFMFPARSPCF